MHAMHGSRENVNISEDLALKTAPRIVTRVYYVDHLAGLDAGLDHICDFAGICSQSGHGTFAG